MESEDRAKKLVAQDGVHDCCNALKSSHFFTVISMILIPRDTGGHGGGGERGNGFVFL